MTYKEIVDLIKLINKTELTEVKIKDGDFKLSIRNKDFQSASSGNVEYTNAPIAYQPITAPALAVPVICTVVGSTLSPVKSLPNTSTITAVLVGLPVELSSVATGT